MRWCGNSFWDIKIPFACHLIKFFSTTIWIITAKTRRILHNRCQSNLHANSEIREASEIDDRHCPHFLEENCLCMSRQSGCSYWFVADECSLRSSYVQMTCIFSIVNIYLLTFPLGFLYSFDEIQRWRRNWSRKYITIFSELSWMNRRPFYSRHGNINYSFNNNDCIKISQTHGEFIA